MFSLSMAAAAAPSEPPPPDDDDDALMKAYLKRELTAYLAKRQELGADESAKE